MEALGTSWSHEHDLILLEAYGRRDDGGPDTDAAALGLVATDGIRLVGAMHVPADEVVFYLVRAPSADSVRQAAHAAGLRVLRIVTASWATPGDGAG